ncbi:MAG: C25 family cysteine peptidase [Planctomycetota bacterium]
MRVLGRLSRFRAGALLALLVVLAPRPAAGDFADGEDFELVIIAPGDFLTPLLALERFKDATGLPADVVDLERVLDMFPAHPEYDAPERIKRALSLWKAEYGIRYAMLVGDADRFPVRWVAQKVDGDPDTVFYYFPSDLYYADLYHAAGGWCSWDSDADGYFGEHLAASSCETDPFQSNLDRCDFHPDLAVGRVPAFTVEEVDRYVAKVIQYELEA